MRCGGGGSFKNGCGYHTVRPTDEAQVRIVSNVMNTRGGVIESMLANTRLVRASGHAYRLRVAPAETLYNHGLMAARQRVFHSPHGNLHSSTMYAP